MQIREVAVGWRSADLLQASDALEVEELAVNASNDQTVLPEEIQLLADRLEVAYTDHLTTVAVDEVVRESYEPMTDARIKSFVPVLVENASRNRLRRLADPGREDPGRAEPAPPEPAPPEPSLGWFHRLSNSLRAVLRAK